MDSIKTNRTVSFIIIAVAYILAAAAGAGVFAALTFTRELWLRLLIADCLATLVIFVFTLIFDNASIYDPYWSVQPMIILPLVIVMGGNISAFSAVIIVLAEVWGVRLTANWAYLFRNLTCQDWRYTNLKNSTGGFYPLVNLFGIQMFPTLVVFGCMLPVIEISSRYIGSINALCLVGVALGVCGILLEIVADTQKHRYRRAGGQGIVDCGIWKKHRHPNYAGEIIFWWGIYITVVAAAPDLWWTGAGALANTLLFAFASIPMAEKQSRLRHPDEWDEYRKNSFVI